MFKKGLKLQSSIAHFVWVISLKGEPEEFSVRATNVNFRSYDAIEPLEQACVLGKPDIPSA